MDFPTLFPNLVPIIAATFIAIAAFWGRRTRSGQWVVPITLGVVFAVAWSFLSDKPSLEPKSARDWLAYLAIAAGFVGAIASFKALPTFVVWVLYAGVAGFFARFLMTVPLTNGGWHILDSVLIDLPGERGGWGTVSASIWVSFVAMLFFGVMLTGDRLQARKTGAGAGFVYGLTTGAIAATLAPSHLSPTFAAAAIGNTIGVWVLASRFGLGKGNGTFGARGTGAALAAIVYLPAALAALNDRLPWEVFLVLLLAPSAALVTELPKIKKLGHWLRVIVGLAATGLFLLMALALTGYLQMQAGGGDGYYGY